MPDQDGPQWVIDIVMYMHILSDTEHLNGSVGMVLDLVKRFQCFVNTYYITLHCLDYD